MNWIERKLTSPGTDGLKPERVRVPPARDVLLALDDAGRASFWSRAIDAYVQRIVDGSRLPERPTTPMPGGHGTLYTDARHSLCTSYLYDRSPQERAHVVLNLLGAPVEDEQTREGYQAHAWRIAAAVWVVQNPVVVDGVEVGSQVLPSDRWMLVLAALYDVARRGVDSYSIYRTAVDRCNRTAPILSDAWASRAGYGHGGRQDIQRSRPEQWQQASASLAEGGPSADRLLAGLVLREICARLYVALSQRPKRTNTFFLQMAAWLKEASQAKPSSVGSNGDACAGAHQQALARLLPTLLEMRPFGGTGDADCGEAYPAEFRPYRGGSGVRLARMLRRLTPDVHGLVAQAHQLGVLIADRVMDPMLVVYRGDSWRRQEGDWIDHAAYWNLDSLMRQSVTQMGWSSPTPLPPSASRLQIQSFAREAKTSNRPDTHERTALAVQTALKGAPPSHRAEPSWCALCTTRRLFTRDAASR